MCRRVNDRRGIRGQVLDGIGHAEHFDPAAMIVDAPRDGAVDDRPQSRLNRKVAGDRAVQDQLNSSRKVAPWVM